MQTMEKQPAVSCTMDLGLVVSGFASYIYYIYVLSFLIYKFFELHKVCINCRKSNVFLELHK